MNSRSKPAMIPNYNKKCWKKSENFNIRKKSENFETPYKNLEKYRSFSKFRISMEKFVMLATLLVSMSLIVNLNGSMSVKMIVRVNMSL